VGRPVLSSVGQRLPRRPPERAENAAAEPPELLEPPELVEPLELL